MIDSWENVCYLNSIQHYLSLDALLCDKSLQYSRVRILRITKVKDLWNRTSSSYEVGQYQNF